MEIPPEERVIFPLKDVDEKTALLEEINLIEKWGRMNNGTGILENKTDGGDTPPKQYKSLYTPYKRTPEIREKCSNSSHKKRKTWKTNTRRN